MNIRKAIPADAAAIAGYLLLAMEDIVYQFIGSRDHQQAMALMRHFAAGTRNQYAYENCWVAVMEGEVVGAINVYDGADLHALRQPVIDYLASHHNRVYVPEDETGPGEYYIDSFGVHPNFQGKGVGTALLQFVIDVYVHQQGQTLGLLVEETNPGAKRLYRKLGFEPVGERVVFGKRMEHLQVRGIALQ